MDEIDFAWWQQVTFPQHEMAYLPVRPLAIANDDYYSEANIGKYVPRYDRDADIDFLPVLQ